MPVSRLVILPYKLGSQSAKRLADGVTERLQLKVRRIGHVGNYRPNLRSLVVNYGSSVAPVWLNLTRERQLNPPYSCHVASNKLEAFKLFSENGVSCVEWTTSQEQALQWISTGSVVVCRTTLTGHSGSGIVLAFAPAELVAAPLYTKYKKKKKEFRVHVFKETIIDVTEKRGSTQNRPEGLASLIRNHRNGWVFCRDNVVEPATLRNLSVDACRALCLDFGAVDILWNEYENKGYVLEVNTAPGLEGTTLTKYVDAIYSWQRNI